MPLSYCSRYFGAELYKIAPDLNHPPSMLHILSGILWISDRTHLPFGFWLRFPDILADAGSLWRTGSAASSPALSQSLIANPQTIRSSFGAGLVWDSILGPIRVDYAYPTTKAATDITQRLRFSAGGF